MTSKLLRTSWNVFLPQQILREPPNYLIGIVYHDMNIICVHGLTAMQKPPLNIGDIIGFWQQTDDRPPCFDNSEHLSNFRFIVRKSAHNNVVFCRLETKLASECMTVLPVTCIVFNPHEFEASYVLLHCTKTEHKETKNDCVNHQFGCPESPVSVIARSIEKHQIKMCSESRGKSFYRSTQRVSEASAKLLLLVSYFLVWMVSWIGHFVSLGMQFFNKCLSRLPKFLQKGSFIDHLEERTSCYRRVLHLDRSDKFNTFLLYNCCGQQFMDTCFGLLLILLFVYFDLASLMSSYILDWADNIARELLTLIRWLMGSPAGMKLNAQLTKFLGHFFIYHIYLWTGYLNLLRNVMPYVIWASSMSGIFGATFQMCLAIDVLSMLTLHIYCFYVYAAKVFNLQVYVMRSLWRLFRGKKWNVLRSRVDSASYDIDQLFFGTLLFTILLFLLPTTALYYAVFTVLRLLVLTAQGILSRIVAVAKSTPIFTLVLRIFAPKLVAGSVMFKVPYLPEEENCLVLHMKTSQIPLGQLMRLTTSVLSPGSRDVHQTWREFFSYLATGKLIYPWVEVMSEAKDKRQ